MLEKREAEKRIPGSSKVLVSSRNQGIKFIQLRDDYFYSATNQTEWLSASLKFTKTNSLKELHKETDLKGFTHTKYQVCYKNLPIESFVYSVHATDGKIRSANGEYFLGKNISITPLLSEKEAFERALSFVNAQKYQWEVNNEVRPSGELVIFPVDSTYVLTYKFDIYAINPMSRQFIFVDANSGQIIKAWNRIHIVNSTGTAKTMYNGTVSITTDSYNGSYRLRESGRGQGIETYNLHHSSDYTVAADFVDADNNWTDSTDYNLAANDAHYATEATYDYYFTKFRRNSFDNNGSKILSYVHYGDHYSNAFWNGTCMTYGDGDGLGYLPFTPVEVVAHEITHGVTEHSAGLIYSGESGALNESFSDIFGVVVDFYKNPTKANYLMGESVSKTHTPFRSMSNPNDYYNPKAYHGLYWDPYQEVHTNSGVQNYWFYLLCEGGRGINEFGNSFNVKAIGRERAAQIAYRNLTVYLTPNSTYADARFYSIQSAIDLFGDCSPEVIAVSSAWYAVGVGDVYDGSVLADFVESKTNVCNLNSPVYFSNRSINGNSFKWYFGDGASDTSRNPVHFYSAPGTYSVRLISFGSALCKSSDTVYKTGLIKVSNGIGPILPKCVPHTLYPGSGGIYHFGLNTINNQTNGSRDDYQDYSCTNQTSLIEGKEYELSLSVGYAKAENVKLWIDFNNNGSFNDPGELVYQKDSMIGSFSDKVIIPKGSVYNSPLRLRVGSDYSDYSVSPCSNTNGGQFQDYTVTIMPNNSRPEARFSSNLQLVAKGDSIMFKDETLNTPVSWLWNFYGGKPTFSNLRNPVVVYENPGTYTVSLTVTNAFGKDTLVRQDYIQVLEHSYCIEDLGGGGCPGDISSVSINGTTLNNVTHLCSIDNGSTYALYPSTGNTTAILEIDSLYQLSVTTLNPDIISVWIDFNQNGVFEDSEWNQVTINSSPSVPSTVNLKIPTTALPGKTRMRIRSRIYGNSNGAYDACTKFGSGITEDYIVTINNLPRPANVTAAVKDIPSGQVFLKWDYANNSGLPASTGYSNAVFKEFLIYRDGILIASTTNNSYNDVLHNYGSFSYEVSAKYFNGESAASSSNKLDWFGSPKIGVAPSSFEENVMKGDTVTGTLKIYNYGNGLLCYKIAKNSITLGEQSVFKTETSYTGLCSFVNENPKTEHVNTVSSFIKRIVNEESVNPIGLENILVFEGVPDGSVSYYDKALGKLGLSRTLVNNLTDFNSLLNNGTKWDLIIVNSYINALSQTILDLLEKHLSSGGKLIYADWGVYKYSTHSLFTLLGISFISNLNTPINFSAIDTSKSIFNSPNRIYRLKWDQNQANVDGQKLGILTGANRLADFDDSQTPAIVVDKTGNAIFNAFQSVNYNGDSNNNGSADILEMLENEIFFLMQGANSEWLRLGTYSGNLLNGEVAYIPVTFDAKNKPAGVYRDTIVVSSTSIKNPVIKIPCLFKVIGSPTADFKAVNAGTYVGKPVQFVDLTSGDPIKWKWSFEGGTPSSSSDKNPVVIYSKLGSYGVSLISENRYGKDTVIKKGYIQVVQPIDASFYASKTNIIAGSSVNFYDNSVNNPIGWKWSFSGGTPSTSFDKNPWILYEKPGVYDVVLNAYNVAGEDSMVKFGYISVAAPPKPVADFSQSSRTIYEGSSVYYYSSSLNNPKTLSWFTPGGNPSYTSNSQSINVIYPKAGIYDVTLIAVNSGGADTIIRSGCITVKPYLKPVANFWATNTNVTAGTLVNFYDNSGNLPSQWKWSFPGASPNIANSQYAYALYDKPGKYDVKLVVSNSAGSDSIVKLGYIVVTVPPKPIANFRSSTNTVLVGSYVSFSDSSLNNPTSWRWQFVGGSPQSSSSGYTNVQYNTVGNYDVKMVVSNAGGTDSIVKKGLIKVVSALPGDDCSSAQDLSLLSSPYSGTTEGYKSDVIFCNSSTSSDRIFFIDVPSGQTLYIGQTYNNFDSRHMIRIGGSCPGITELTCVDDPDYQTYVYNNNTGASQRIYYILGGYSSGSYGKFTLAWKLTTSLKPVAEFTAENTSVIAGSSVYFSDHSFGNPYSWEWSFPGGSPSSSFYANPSVYYYSPGKYKVSLVVSNANGSDSIVKDSYITVSPMPKPIASFSVNSTNLVAGSTTYFYDNSSNTVSNRCWTFEGGSPSTSYDWGPNVTYNNPGLYTVKLVVSNSGGTDSIVRMKFITVTAPQKPIANFYATQNIISGSGTYFNDNSANDPTWRRWTFEGGSPSYSYSNSPYVYYSKPGNYAAKLVVGNSSGADSITKVNYIHVSAKPKPVADFSTYYRVVTPGSYVSFNNYSTNNPTSYLWTFIGGSPNRSTFSYPYVKYDNSGFYDVKLVATNESGSDSIVKKSYIWVTPSPYCISNLGGSYSCPGDIIAVSLSGTGLNNINHNNCSTQSSSTYAMYAPDKSLPNILESGKNYELSVTTINSDIISVWIDFDRDGVFETNEWQQVAVNTSPNVANKIVISIPQNINPGETVMRIRSCLTGSANGATDACSYFYSGITEDYILTLADSKGLWADRTEVCKGDTVLFTNSISGTTFNYDFGDGATPQFSSSNSPVSVVYNTPGFKTVKLIVDQNDTVVKINYVNVHFPEVFRLNADSTYCQGSYTNISTTGSASNSIYQLQKNGFDYGVPKIGTGVSLNWPYITKGRYSAIAKVDNISCDARFTDSLLILEKPIPVTPIVAQTGKSLISSCQTGNQWYSFQFGIIRGATSGIFVPFQDGSYYTKVTENGCTSEASNVITVILTSDKDLQDSTLIMFYPNPVVQKLYINSDKELNVERIEIYNTVGSMVKQKIPELKTANRFNMDVSDLVVGYYTVVLVTKYNRITNKVFKAK
jgi:Zinc metalloprotease (elastase)